MEYHFWTARAERVLRKSVMLRHESQSGIDAPLTQGWLMDVAFLYQFFFYSAGSVRLRYTTRTWCPANFFILRTLCVVSFMHYATMFHTNINHIGQIGFSCVNWPDFSEALTGASCCYIDRILSIFFLVTIWTLSIGKIRHMCHKPKQQKSLAGQRKFSCHRNELFKLCYLQ